jgi:HD-GYP domain-containing protein (c-di-GMP phosphodiesterase class II)
MEINKDNEKLLQILALEAELYKIKDLDIMLERILTEARHFAMADAGSIYIKQNNMLHFKYTQNDTMQKRLDPGKKLIYTTFSIPVDTKSIAGFVAVNGDILNIEDAYNIPDFQPFSFDRKFDSISGYKTKSMLTFPLKNSRDKIIGVLQLINTKNSNDEIISFSKQDEPFIMHFAHVAANSLEKAQIMRSIILRMIKLAELHDPKETGAHVNRVGAFSVEIYEAWAIKQGVSTEEINRQKDVLRMAAMLHDIGKIAISDKILKKPAKLDPDEYAIIKLHTIFGARVFEELWSDFDEAAYDIALNHHERWDGKGYPGHVNPFTNQDISANPRESIALQGKKGNEISILARIVSLADVFDALSSKRSYKEPWPEEKVLDLIKNESDKQFDPAVIEAFFSCLDELKSIAKRYPD